MYREKHFFFRMSEPNQKPVLSYYSEDKHVIYQIAPTERSALEDLIRTCRLEVADACDEVCRVVEIGKAHTNGKNLYPSMQISCSDGSARKPNIKCLHGK